MGFCHDDCSWFALLLLQTVLLAKQVYPNLTGRVHAQASPSAAYDTEATIQHAKKLVALFEANGIPKFARPSF